MSINYANYTLDELLDVNKNIDRGMYPDRYKQLSEEIQRRKQNGEFEKKSQEIEAQEDEDEFFIEFASDGNGISRKLFISAFVLINIVVLTFLLPKYIVSDISDIHEYSTEIDFIKCHKIEVIDDETDTVNNYFDLDINSYQDTFSAVDIGEEKCNNLAKNLKVGSNISIWHENGLIHQLKSQDDMLLSYSYMKPKVRELRTDGDYLYWIGLIVLWVILFKSLANAVVPGTFTLHKKVNKN